MANQVVVDYIKKARQAGLPDDQIKSVLYKNGWTEADVNENFLAVAGPEQKAVPSQNVPIQITPAQTAPIQSTPVQSNVQANIVQNQSINQSQSTVSKKKSPIMMIILIVILIILLGVGGFFIFKERGILSSFLKLTQIKPSEVVNNNVEVPDYTKPTFAEYKLETTKFTPKLETSSILLPDISNLAAFEKSQAFAFTVAQKDSLVKNNFVITKNYDKFFTASEEGGATRNDDWTGLYKKIGGSYNVWDRLPENSVFVSTDFTLHVYHKLVDEEFSYIEQSTFYPTLNDLSKSLLKSSADALNATQDPIQKASYERLSAYFLISSSILDNAVEDYNQFKQFYFVADSQKDKKENVLQNAELLAQSNNVPENVLNTAKQEIELIFDAKIIAPSPLFGRYQKDMPEDYTQFTPRSHYAKNIILRDYFRAMMWYGRINFLLNSPELTRDAANMNLLISADNLKKWESIYLPTSFFVGQSDDLGVYDYKQAIKKINFSNSDATNASIIKLQEELKTYKNPQVMSTVVISEEVLNKTKEELQNETKGFRFMGQRFTPDAFIFSSLTQGDEKPDLKTGQKLPSTPTSLMVSSLMGSKTSGTLLNEWIKANAPKSDKVIADRMQSLQTYFNAVTPQQWTQNIYWSWLYTIKSLFTESVDKTGYPGFIKSADWDKKNLQCFSGSWTELKHDTLLYAKQSYAEMGAAGPEEKPAKPVPKGYVEPNIEFFDRLIALVNLTKDGLKQFGVLPETFESRNDQFIKSLQLYRRIAVSELQNEIISDEDFEKLRLDAGSLDNILYPPDTQIVLEKNARSAIIADVHTDIKKGQILYEADGIPNYIFVAVKDANGTRLTKGLVYSYYEFTSPLTKRLTDQDWQKWSYSDTTKIPIMPWWNKSLIK